MVNNRYKNNVGSMIACTNPVMTKRHVSKICFEVASEYSIRFTENFYQRCINDFSKKFESLIIDDKLKFREFGFILCNYALKKLTYEEALEKLPSKALETNLRISAQALEEYEDVNEKINMVLRLNTMFVQLYLANYLSDVIGKTVDNLSLSYYKDCLASCQKMLVVSSNSVNSICTLVQMHTKHFRSNWFSICKVMLLDSLSMYTHGLDEWWDDLENYFYLNIECSPNEERVREVKPSEQIMDSLFGDGTDGSVTYKLLDNYKDLNKLANDNGFSYVRANGDHGIFKNSKGDVVVIPQGRSVGKGLSIRIQKSILEC